MAPTHVPACGRRFAPGCYVAWRNQRGRKCTGLVESHVVGEAGEIAVVWEGARGQGAQHVLRDVPLFLDEEIAAHRRAWECAYCARPRGKGR